MKKSELIAQLEQFLAMSAEHAYPRSLPVMDFMPGPSLGPMVDVVRMIHHGELLAISPRILNLILDELKS
jgi:hypothetical protein